MALADVHWFSQSLGKMVGMHVVLPGVGAGPFPVLYLLHGLSDDYTAWLRRTRIEWYLRDLPFIVVMADGGRGFYTDNAAGPAYGTFFAQELPSFIERQFHARTDRAARCIGGLSMGGYGALRLALAHPDRYASATSHSGALLAWEFDPNRTTMKHDEYARIFGPAPEGTAHDLITLARQATSFVPKLRLDCGTEDFLLPSNRSVHEAWQLLGLPHEYEEFAGGHDWDYWDTHVCEALAFHCRAMGIGVPKALGL